MSRGGGGEALHKQGIVILGGRRYIRKGKLLEVGDVTLRRERYLRWGRLHHEGNVICGGGRLINKGMLLESVDLFSGRGRYLTSWRFFGVRDVG